MKSFITTLVIISCSIHFESFAQNETGFGASAQFDLYILAGQSNMAGRGKLTDSLKALRDDRVWMLTKDLTWVVARHPIHFDKPAVVGVGPGLAFGIEMANAF